MLATGEEIRSTGEAFSPVNMLDEVLPRGDVTLGQRWLMARRHLTMVRANLGR